MLDINKQNNNTNYHLLRSNGNFRVYRILFFMYQLVVIIRRIYIAPFMYKEKRFATLICFLNGNEVFFAHD